MAVHTRNFAYYASIMLNALYNITSCIATYMYRYVRKSIFLFLIVIWILIQLKTLPVTENPSWKC